MSNISAYQPLHEHDPGLSATTRDPINVTGTGRYPDIDFIRTATDTLLPFNHRCVVEMKSGANYFDDPAAIGPTVQRVGITYQVASFGPIDVVSEVFDVKLEIKYIYKVCEEDAGLYKIAKERSADNKHDDGLFQGLFDNGVKQDKDSDEFTMLKTKPPILEFRNATALTIVREQVTSVQLMRSIEGEVAHYVSLTGVYSASCYENIELDHFPFSRQGLQVRLVAKMDTNKMLIMPWSAVAPPHVVVDPPDGTAPKGIRQVGNSWVKDNFEWLRANTYKHFAYEIGNWKVVNHHIAFVPIDLTPPMPSGNKFTRTLITVQVEQMPRFYLLKTLIVIFPMTLVSLIAFIASDIDGEAVANQLAILMALAAYTLMTTDWQPARKSLSYIDKYILVSLVLIIVTCVWMNLRMTLYKLFVYGEGDSDEGDTGKFYYDTGEPGPQSSRIEIFIWVAMIIAWTAFHVRFLLSSCRPAWWSSAKSPYPRWIDVFSEERRQLKVHASNVERELQDATHDWLKALEMLKHRDETGGLLFPLNLAETEPRKRSCVTTC